MPTYQTHIFRQNANPLHRFQSHAIARGINGAVNTGYFYRGIYTPSAFIEAHEDWPPGVPEYSLQYYPQVTAHIYASGLRIGTYYRFYWYIYSREIRSYSPTLELYVDSGIPPRDIRYFYCEFCARKTLHYLFNPRLDAQIDSLGVFRDEAIGDTLPRYVGNTLEYPSRGSYDTQVRDGYDTHDGAINAVWTPKLAHALEPIHAAGCTIGYTGIYPEAAAATKIEVTL